MKGLLSLVCGVQPVRVVYGDGEVLYLPPLTTVSEILASYPHHFVVNSGSSNQMLPLEAELQSDCIYFLLPVPRMFPTAPFPSSQCKCYEEGAACGGGAGGAAGGSPLKVYSSPQRIGGLGSPLRGRSLRHWMMMKGSKSSRVLPESTSSLYSAGREELAMARPVWRSCPWRPRLGCISEEDDLELALEELRYYGFGRKKEVVASVAATPAAAKPIASSPLRPQLKPSKSSRYPSPLPFDVYKTFKQ